MKQGIVFRMQIGRSRWLLAYLVLMHSVMLITFFSLQITLIWCVLGSAMLILSFIVSCCKYQWLRNAEAINQIERAENGLWQLVYSSGKKQPALKLESGFVTNKVVIIYLKNRSRYCHFSIVILSDAVDEEMFRQLRVYLRDPNVFLK